MSVQNSYQVHSVEVENVRDSYTEFDSIDAHLDFEGRALVCGSVRVNFEYQILTGGASLAGTERVSFDENIGGHAFFANINTSFQNVGLVENLVEYPRYVATETAGSLSRNDLMVNQYVCEGRTPDKMTGRTISFDRVPVDIGGGAVGAGQDEHNGSGQSAVAALKVVETVNPDCSIKPLIAVNNVAGVNKLLNYSTSGQIKLSFNLERNTVCLYGEDMAAGITYQLTNVRVSFSSVPETKQQLPIQMKAHICLKSTINSSLANISSKVPAVADGVLVSFLTQNREVAALFKNTALEKLPSVSKLRYMFNDSTNKYISFELKHINDMIAEGIKAVNKNNGRTLCRADLLSANEGFFVGLPFNEVDLSKSKFNIQIENSQPINPMLMYAYYSSIISL